MYTQGTQQNQAPQGFNRQQTYQSPQQGYYPQQNYGQYQQQPQYNPQQTLSQLQYSINYYNIDLGALFAKYNQSGSSELNIQEFGRLLQKINPSVQQGEIQAAFSFIDRDGGGSLSFQEFSQALKNQNQQYQNSNMIYQKPQQPREQVEANAELAIMKLVQAIYQFNIDINQLFVKYNMSSPTVLTYPEFTNLLRFMQPSMSDQEIGVAFWKFDKDGDQNITIQEFKITLEEQLIKAQSKMNNYQNQLHQSNRHQQGQYQQQTQQQGHQQQQKHQHPQNYQCQQQQCQEKGYDYPEF